MTHASLKPLGIVVAALLHAAWPGTASASECQGRLGAETSISGKTGYDPFSPVDVTDDYRISITNTGAAPPIRARRLAASA